ncbi:hypothetical protein [Candidatus Electronema sp. JM]
MPEAVSNTSPLLYLHRIGAADWLPLCSRKYGHLMRGQRRTAGSQGAGAD